MFTLILDSQITSTCLLRSKLLRDYQLKGHQLDPQMWHSDPIRIVEKSCIGIFSRMFKNKTEKTEAG
jgi:hypothetical protein